jgi:cytochrome P450/NADPH-cytochrome P450 reductase
MATEEIPGPPGLPFLGNVIDVDPTNSMVSLRRLADIYGTFTSILTCVRKMLNGVFIPGPIFKLTLGGTERLFITTQELLNEICDEKRFTKVVAGSLNEVRNGIGDGLFTARHGEHNWELAHRVLMPGKYLFHPFFME